MLGNTFLRIFSCRFGLAKTLNRPKIFAIESTNMCQLECPMCPRKELSRKIGNISFDLFKKIIDRDATYTETLYLDEMGETLLHPDICQLIKYARNKSIRIYLNTNAVNLNEKMSGELLKTGVEYIQFSFDGATQEIYGKVRRNANFEHVQRNILNFLKMKDDLGYKSPFTMVSMIEMIETKPYVDSFRHFWEAKADKVWIKPFTNWDGSLKSITELAPESQDILPAKTRCPILWGSVVVLWDGRVVPCCYDYDAKCVIGDLNTESLEEIWNGEKMRELRKKHVTGNRDKIPLCKSCAVGIEKYYPLETVQGVLLGSSRGQ